MTAGQDLPDPMRIPASPFYRFAIALPLAVACIVGAVFYPLLRDAERHIRAEVRAAIEQEILALDARFHDHGLEALRREVDARIRSAVDADAIYLLLGGDGTRLAAGGLADHGFAALAELDSDGDGAITPADAAWSELVVWADADADRRTSGWELLPLAAYGIDALAIDFRVDVDCDARGNCSRERAPFSAGAGGLAGELVDVHLVCD